MELLWFLLLCIPLAGLIFLPSVNRPKPIRLRSELELARPLPEVELSRRLIGTRFASPETRKPLGRYPAFPPE